MYLSRVELDPIRRSTMTALAAPQKFHGAVESAFSGERRRRLWLLARITPGSRWQFRLAANPTKSCKDAQKPAARGTVAAHCTTQYQKQWLLDRAAKHGFALTEDSFTVTRVQWHHFAKRGTRPVSLLAVTYEGVLQVTDPEAFRNLLCQGMGRGKAYGLGLMTIIHRGGDHG